MIEGQAAILFELQVEFSGRRQGEDTHEEVQQAAGRLLFSSLYFLFPAQNKKPAAPAINESPGLTRSSTHFDKKED